MVAYAHDANGRLVSVTDPNGNVTGRAYDRFDRLVRVAFADGQEETFAYDAVGNVTAHRAPGGMATATAYDGMGRPTARTVTQLSGRAYPGTASFRYDALGRLVEARDDDSTVTRTYDTLGNPVEESVQAGGASATRLRRTYDSRGRLAKLDPPGSNNTLSCVRNDDGLVTGISRHTTALAAYGYLGPRPVLRTLTNGAAAVGETVIGYEATGDRPAAISHADAASATVDARTYTWDKADNLTGWQITGWTPPTASATLTYDGLNRLAPASIGAGWTLDGAGNRSGGGYSFTGSDEAMHRYTSVASLPQYHDAQGALVRVAVDADTVKEYHYDVNDRLAHYREVTLAGGTGFAPLDIGDWTQINGAWSVSTGGPEGDYLEETTSAIGAILYTPIPYPDNGFTFRYRSAHAPANPDGNGTPGQFSSSDYPAKYYAQALLAVDTSGGAPYPYAALRIEPDRLSVVFFDGVDLHELDSAAVTTEADVWYTVQLRIVAGGPEGAMLSVERASETPGEPLSALMQSVPVGDLPNIEGDAVGFTVGELADYDFQLVEYAAGPDLTATFVDWACDAYGRKVAETVYDSTNTVTSQTLYVWDGWRLVAELDARENNRVVAEYVPGPGYVDETVAVRRDLNRDGDFADANEGFLYPLADQQHSTVALLNASGAIVERYGYDAFGTPSFYDGAGTALAGGSAVGNTTLYTGRTWLPALGLYDYRQRLYDPATGRFLTPDPAQDPANLGNPYTYTANN
ncbi:MAG: hypothetical protein GXY15_04275, partial [Candidatus Hydrogenedentes bacterium]|nr:hypothetical protein [Candidatus Hydrogenedentota bacterium]